MWCESLSHLQQWYRGQSMILSITSIMHEQVFVYREILQSNPDSMQATNLWQSTPAVKIWGVVMAEENSGEHGNMTGRRVILRNVISSGMDRDLSGAELSPTQGHCCVSCSLYYIPITHSKLPITHLNHFWRWYPAYLHHQIQKQAKWKLKSHMQESTRK